MHKQVKLFSLIFCLIFFKALYSQTTSNYNVVLYADPIDKEFRYNLKSIRGTVSNDISILSMMFGVPSDGFMDSHGNHLISINRNSNKIVDLYNERLMNTEKFFYEQKEINVYNCNSNLNQNNSIFFSYVNNGFVELNEIKLENGTNRPTILQDKIPNTFELNSGNDGIETFKTGGVKLGNGIAGFFGESTYNNKTYLFVYDYKSKIKYRKIDLTKASSAFVNLGITATHGICLKYKGNKNKGTFETNFYSISNIVQNEKFIYVFLGAVNGVDILPLVIDKSNYSISIKSNSFFNKGYFLETNRIINEQRYTGGYFYLPYSSGFINYNKVQEEIKLDVYNNLIEKTWSISLNDIEINHINEYENFIIIGGYTKNSGYKGFPNPKIIVIDKLTHKICYSKVIAKKNALINSINLDSNRNIIISIGGIVDYSEDYSFYPQIITDKLDEQGKFINDLFVK